ncbi:hypothetical protein BGX28_008556 [Mortierella sp. GBA30]|nr:hypothetical protein BGX28_008556 [Mortierella sp. GBA30]
MSNTLAHKYHTLKTKKLAKRLSADEMFPKHSRSASNPSSPTSTIVPVASSAQPVSYTAFLADLISVFNTLSTPSTVPTNSPSLHASFSGADHVSYVDAFQKENVVKALQYADPVKVNEVITFLRAMPDPTATQESKEQKKTHSRESSTQSTSSVKDTKEWGKPAIKKQRRKQLVQELEEWDKVEKNNFWETQKSNNQLTGVVDPESCRGTATASWWLSSVITPAASSPSDVKTQCTVVTTAKPSVSEAKISCRTKDADTTSLLGGLWPLMKTRSQLLPNRSLSTGKQIAQAAASLLATTARSKPNAPSRTEGTRAEMSVRRQSSAPVIRSRTSKLLLATATAHSSDTNLSASKKSATSVVPTTLPSYLISTINSLTRQLMTLHDGIPMVRCFWWGYSIYLNRQSMSSLQRATNTGQVFFSFLYSTIGSHAWLAALLPLIAAWVSHQWSAMKGVDKGRGVVVSATWILPIALAPRSWEDEDDPEPSGAKATLKAKLKVIKRV